MSFFGVGGNPFATQVGQLIDQATDVSLASENWALNMEICDVINETDDGPKDAIRAIRKKLSLSVAKNYQVVMYTLTVLETCVKNCGKRFHLQVAVKDFLQELVKVIGPKNDPPQVVQEKILSLIQTWADAFCGQPELKEVGRVYQDLKNKGIEFPMTDLDAMAPIHTPARTTPQVDPAPRPQQSMQRAPSGRATQPAQQVPVNTGPVHLNPEQLAKLRSELDVVQQNCKVMGEMLTSMTPNQEDPSDLDLLQELNRTCRQMQQRIVDLIERVQNEEVTEELLRVNDDLNNVFLRYDRFQRNKPAPTDMHNAGTLPIRGGTEAPPSYSAAANTAGDSAPVANLIDLDEAPTSNSDIHLTLAGMNLGGNSVSSTLGQINTTTATNSVPQNEQRDEFDMFAQSRQSFDTSSGNAYANQKVDQFQGGLGAAVNAKSGGKVQDTPSDFDEMEKWLQENDQAPPSDPPGDSATSTEFDRFLAERAKEAENLPDINPANSRGNSRGGRQLQKDDQENALFAL